MTRFRKSACVALALAGVVGAATAGDSVPSGRQVFERRCPACHGGTRAPDVPLGSNLVGIIGTKAGTKDSGLHSRAVIDSGTVWNPRPIADLSLASSSANAPNST